MEIVEFRLLRQHSFAIIDASQREIIPASWPVQRIAPSFLGQDTGRCPLLLELSSLSPTDQDEWQAIALNQRSAREPMWFSSLIQTEVDAGRLLVHLRQRLALTVPEVARPMQFRYYDPHTLTQLPRILGDRGLTWFMGPVEAFTYSLPQVAATDFSQLRKPVPHASPPAGFSLTHTHHQQLQRLSAINRLLLKLPLMDGEAQWRARSMQAEALLLRAEQHGLTHSDDQMAFALHGLTVHAHFDNHERIRVLLETLRSAQPEDELDYREVTAGITKAEWLQIAADLNTISPFPQTYRTERSIDQNTDRFTS